VSGCSDTSDQPKLTSLARLHRAHEESSTALQINFDFGYSGHGSTNPKANLGFPL
jgi:hypothetical protein